jgi:branched-chain amino acid transport system substrate-binding protein
MMKRSSMVAAVALLATSACASSSGDDDAAASDSPIEVAILAPFSGDLGYWGEGYRRGIATYEAQFGEMSVGGRDVTIAELDDQCDVATSVAAFQRESQTLTAVLGPPCSAVVQAVEPLAAKSEVPLMILAQSASLTVEQSDGWLFRLTQPDTANLYAFAQHMVEEWSGAGVEKIAVLHDTSVLNKDVKLQWEQAVEGTEIEVAADISFELGDTDFTSQVIKTQQSGATAVAIASYGPEIAQLVKQLNDAGVDVEIAASTDAAYPSTIEAAGDAIEGTSFYSDYLAGSDSEGLQEFEAAFAELYPDLQPQALEYQAYIGAGLLMDALDKTEGEGGTALQDALLEASFAVGDLNVGFLPNGDQESVVTVIGEVEGGQAVVSEVVTEARDSFPDLADN